MRVSVGLNQFLSLKESGIIQTKSSIPCMLLRYLWELYALADLVAKGGITCR